jgi:uncharacterized protein
MRLKALVPLVAMISMAASLGAGRGNLAMETIPRARFEFTGPVGERIEANKDNWLLRAPAANPGLLEMFRVRDRRPVPKLVPWAGEFVGKYVISAVQALRMSSDPRLQDQVKAIVAEFIGTQAEDGYFGPFQKSERLLRHWDLWGHYHALLALALWHEHSGDPAALTAARKAADLVCVTYLDTGRRVFDAGDHEMNMAILTGMVMMHRLTGEERYLRMAREVERDWERAGDYIGAASRGLEFYQSPRPRWESLHDLQGLVELWRVTGETRYRDAFIHHWRSIRRWDRRNTGGFSSGEQATGNPFAPTAIETCCTVAWMALTLDYLRLTGEAAAADELEFSTLNAGIASQHPSGRWWTYNTPMDGSRESSAHSIVFQARPGTPELNCCSVNGPRVLGMLSEWSLMSDGVGLVLNWLGAGRFTAPLADGTSITIISTNDAWRYGSTIWRVESPAGKEFSIRLRVPAWALKPTLKLNGDTIPGVSPGAFVELKRSWKPTDQIEFTSQMGLRAESGAREMERKVSLHYGPLLLAFDQAHNKSDADNLASVDLAKLDQFRVLPASDPIHSRKPAIAPWLVMEVSAKDDQTLRLVDYASAGATGTHYRSWLPSAPDSVPPVFTQFPADGARIPPGQLVFQWLGTKLKGVRYRIEFSTDHDFSRAFWTTESTSTRLELDSSKLTTVDTKNRIYWRVVTKGANGERIPNVPASWFQLDPNAPPQKAPPELVLGPADEVIVHSLRTNDSPKFGTPEVSKFSKRDSKGTELNGKDEKLIYATPWPADDFTVSLCVRVKDAPRNRIAQIFSAWSANMDDPLRIVVDNGNIFARVEAGGIYSTPGVPVEPGRTYAIAAIKKDGRLALYIDGRSAGSCNVPLVSTTQSTACALGGNPKFNGNEYLAACFADFQLHARALSEDEIQRLAKDKED